MEKNALLKDERGISFEDVVYHIMAGNILETIDRPNQERYPGQKIHMVAIEEYVHLMNAAELSSDWVSAIIEPAQYAVPEQARNMPSPPLAQ